MAAKKRAFKSAFTPNSTKPASSSSNAASVSAASASLYDFDCDDADPSASTIVARRATLVAPKPLRSSRRLNPAATTAKKPLQSQRSGSATGEASTLAKSVKPAPKKARPRSSVLTGSMTASKSTATAAASASTTSTAPVQPTISISAPRVPAQPSAPARRPPPTLAHASTTLSVSARPPTLTRQTVSDLYDMPMDDAPPLRKPTTARNMPIQPAKPVQKRQPPSVARAPAKLAIHKESQSSATASATASATTKRSVKFATGRIDSYFTRTQGRTPDESSGVGLPAPRRGVFNAESHSLAREAARSPAKPLEPTPTPTPTPKSKHSHSRSLSRTDPDPDPDPKLNTRSTSSSARPTTPKSTRSLVKSKPQSNPSKRRRLIDALVAQAESSSESSDSDSDSGTVNAPPSTVIDNTMAPTIARPTIRSGLGMQSRGPKVTYASAQRSLRPDPNKDDPNYDPFVFSLMSSLGSPTKQKDSFDFGDGPESDDDALPKGTIRSAHELRMAGANHRFADQMDDLFDRIAKPSAKPNSMRRNALLDLASRIKEKSFSRQFRDNSAEARLFAQVGQETDIVSGFAIVAILLTLLSSSSIPHLLPMLQEQKVPLLLQRLLNCTESITELSLQRQTNLSKNGKMAIESLKKDIAKLPIWKGASTAKDMSPRTLTLKFMDLYGKPGDMGNYVVSSKTMGDTLFLVLDQYTDHEWREDATLDEKLDCLLAASILGAHAMGFELSGLAPHWNSKHFPVVISVVDITLSSGKFGPFEHAVLRLALNMSNNNPGAVTATGILALFKNYAAAIHMTFGEVKDSIGKVDLATEFSPFTKLVLMLGSMINFCEHCPPVRHSVDDWTEQGSPIDGLIELFLQDHMSTYQADSVEKTQLNVGYGYLSILLAYLCLLRSVRRKLEARSGGKGLLDLRDSVREFMILQNKVDNGQGRSDHVQRIQRLLSELEMGIENRRVHR